MHSYLKRRLSFYPYLVDLPLALGSLWLADWVRHEMPVGLPIKPETIYLTPTVYGTILAVWLLLYPLLLKQATLDTLEEELRAVLFGTFLSAFALTSLLYLLKVEDFSRVLFVYFVLLYAVFVCNARMALRWAVGRWQGEGSLRVLVVGAGETGREVAREIASGRWAGATVVGFLDDSPMQDGRRLGALADAARVVEAEQIDEVVIALPGSSSTAVADCITSLLALPVRIKLVPDLFQLATIRASTGTLGNIPLIGLRDPVLSDFDATVKRLFDIAVSAAALLFAGPIMVLIAVLIKLDSPGPTFFVQERIGENGRPFRMYKFRSMVADAELRLAAVVNLGTLSEPVFKVKGDPRVTRVGRLIRRTSLDELPQLLNILRGDMSLVGPRPEEARMVALYNAWQRKRLAVKPGLTGPMQVYGRGDLSLEQRVRLELTYIEGYSFWRDLVIMVRTIPAVLGGKGSY